MSSETVRALVALGSNLGDSPSIIENALMSLMDLEHTRIEHIGAWYNSQPVGGPKHQPVFINGAVSLKTRLSPISLLENLHRIEDALDRQRLIKDGPRTIDLDLIDYNAITHCCSKLILPHPRAKERAFVLLPIKDIDAMTQIDGDSVTCWIDRLPKSALDDCERRINLHVSKRNTD